MRSVLACKWRRNLIGSNSFLCIVFKTFCNYTCIILKSLKIIILILKNVLFPAENFARKMLNVRECPGCGHLCTPIKQNSKIVRCDVCSLKHGRSFDWCWTCLQVTKYTECVNPECNDTHLRQKMLDDDEDAEPQAKKISKKVFHSIYEWNKASWIC